MDTVLAVSLVLVQNSSTVLPRSRTYNYIDHCSLLLSGDE